jgi:hypothetical protein
METKKVAMRNRIIPKSIPKDDRADDPDEFDELDEFLELL